MASSGVNYFLDNFSSFDLSSNWKIWFSFKETGNISPSISGANSLYSGIYNNTFLTSYDYRNISKSGNQVGNIQISPSTGLWGDEFSLVFLNRKNDPKNGILFNCLETGILNSENVYKGFILGFTDGSRPYFCYYGPNGFETLVVDFSVSSNHLVYLTRDNSNIIIGKYDYLTEENINNSFNINSNYLFEPSSYYIGWYSGNYIPNQLWNSNNSQIIDEFMMFSYPLYDFDIQMIASGWGADYTPQTSGSGVIYSTGITGVQNIITGYTGITGYGITGTGFLTNEYGIGYTGYLSGYLTGTIYQSGVIQLTGLIETLEYFTIPEGIQINSGFFREFYLNYFTFLRKIDDNDLNSIYYETGHINNINYNQFGIFDNISDRFKVFKQEPINSWVNGIAQFSGNKINIGTIYNPKYILNRDYYRTGSYIDSNGFYNDLDTFWYVDISGIIYYESGAVIDNGGNIIIPSEYNNNIILFMNGQKWISGENFDVIGSSEIQFKNIEDPGFITGDLSVIQLYGKRKEETGNFAWKQTNTNFNPNYTIGFMNGQQQIRDKDFILSDKANMISGSGIFDSKESLIFNNFNINDIFFE